MRSSSLIPVIPRTLVETARTYTSPMADMTIRRATAADIPQIDELLRQVLEVHHAGRPDLFKGGAKKYTDEELKTILADDQTPVFVAVAPADTANAGDAESVSTAHSAEESSNTGSLAVDQVLGYAFCVFQQHTNSNILTNIKTLYIDDLCVDERSRSHHVGSTLYHYVLDFARKFGCYNVTLNVWACNPKAQTFYERMGLTPYRIGMEQIL